MENKVGAEELQAQKTIDVKKSMCSGWMLALMGVGALAVGGAAAYHTMSSKDKSPAIPSDDNELFPEYLKFVS